MLSKTDKTGSGKGGKTTSAGTYEPMMTDDYYGYGTYEPMGAADYEAKGGKSGAEGPAPETSGGGGGGGMGSSWHNPHEVPPPVVVVPTPDLLS